MFEATVDFFHDAYNRRLSNMKMLDILQALVGLDDTLPLGQAVHDLHKLTPMERNYICCVLLERDQDLIEWQQIWNDLESEAFC